MVATLNTSTPGRDVGYQVDQVLRKTVNYSDTAPVIIGGLPANAVVVNGSVHVTTAFNAGSTNVISIGYTDATASAASAFASAMACGALGTTPFDDLSTSAALPLSRATNVTATYAQTGSAATTGACEVVVRYVASQSS